MMYLEKGKPVEVLVRPTFRKGTKRNCLIRRADGRLVIRPFRGLRRLLKAADYAEGKRP